MTVAFAENVTALIVLFIVVINVVGFTKTSEFVQMKKRLNNVLSDLKIDGWDEEMRISTTDGQIYDVPDFCPYCDLDTAGNHQAGCPNRNVKVYPE